MLRILSCVQSLINIDCHFIIFIGLATIKQICSDQELVKEGGFLHLYKGYFSGYGSARCDLFTVFFLEVQKVCLVKAVVFPVVIMDVRVGL